MTAAEQLDPRRLTVDEYFALEEGSAERWEYLRGVAYAMAGATPNHMWICSSLMQLLTTQLKPRGCRVAMHDAKVRSAEMDSYVYPDLAAVCDEPAFEPDRTGVLLNPTAIFEVLSPSTEAMDRGRKSEIYRKIESVQVYVMIAQDRPRVEWLARSGAFWTLHEVAGPDAVAEIEPLGISLPLQAIYEDVTFDTPA